MFANHRGLCKTWEQKHSQIEYTRKVIKKESRLNLDMKIFKKKRTGKDPGMSVQFRDDDDYTVTDFLTDFEGHKEDLQEWGQIVRSFSMFEEHGGQIHQSRSIHGVQKGMSKKRSDNENTQEGKALYNLRKKLMKKKNLQKKKQRQSKVVIARTYSNLTSIMERKESVGTASFGRTRSDSFLGEDVKGRTIIINNKSREERNPASLARHNAYDQRDSSLLEEPCYCGTLEETLDTLGDTLEEYHNSMEAERMQRREQMLKEKTNIKRDKVNKTKKKTLKRNIRKGLK